MTFAADSRSFENRRHDWLAKPFGRLSVYNEPGVNWTPAPRKHKPMRALPSLTLAAILAVAATTSPVLADVRCGGVGPVRVGVAPPPPLPETEQPPMPGYGYEWTPGSWGWNPDINDYYWTPGAWILPPAIGLFWTPGFWAWDDGVYVFSAGYWGPHVGFYGGVNYGFGYFGHGYDGGYWRGRTFYYNRAYNNIGRLRINALYDRRVAGDRLRDRTSFNGGPHGVAAVERADERLADHDRHIAATADQARHFQTAAGDRTLRASVNHGHPLPAGAASAAAGHVVAAHVAASHMGGPHTGVAHFRTTHVATGHAAPSHGMYGYQHPAAVQPRHDAGYSHYAPVSHYAPAYGPPARGPSQSFRAEPQHWSSPSPGPVREGSPRGAQSEHPHQQSGGRHE